MKAGISIVGNVSVFKKGEGKIAGGVGTVSNWHSGKVSQLHTAQWFFL